MQTVRGAETTAASHHGYFEEMETVSRLRPLARRRFSTARPAFVFIRARKPWERLRRTRLGWYVRFISPDPVGSRYLAVLQPFSAKVAQGPFITAEARIVPPAHALSTNHSVAKTPPEPGHTRAPKPTAW